MAYHNRMSPADLLVRVNEGRSDEAQTSGRVRQIIRATLQRFGSNKLVLPALELTSLRQEAEIQ